MTKPTSFFCIRQKSPIVPEDVIKAGNECFTDMNIKVINNPQELCYDIIVEGVPKEGRPEPIFEKDYLMYMGPKS